MLTLTRPFCTDRETGPASANWPCDRQTDGRTGVESGDPPYRLMRREFPGGSLGGSPGGPAGGPTGGRVGGLPTWPALLCQQCEEMRVTDTGMNGRWDALDSPIIIIFVEITVTVHALSRPAVKEHSLVRHPVLRRTAPHRIHPRILTQAFTKCEPRTQSDCQP